MNRTSLPPDIRRGRPAIVLVIGCLLLLVYLGLEAFVDYSATGEGRVVGQILGYHADQLRHRVTVALMLAGFIGYVWLVIRHRDRLETALEHAVQQARDEQAKSEAIIAAMSDGVSIQDSHFRIVYQNAAHKAMSGGDHRGELCYRAYGGNDEVCFACPVADAFADGQVHRLEKQGPAGSGVEFVELIASPIRNDGGELVGCLEIVRDITAWRHAAEELRKQALFFQRLIDTIPSPVFYKDTRGVFLGCNAAFEACISLPREEVIGRTLFDLMPPDIATMYTEKDDELFAAPGTQIYETHMQCAATGARREVIFYKATYTNHFGELAGLVGVVIDISERTAAERAITALNRDLSSQAEALLAANRELEAYNYSFNHDLRNNLTRISSASQLLEELYSERIPEEGLALLNGVIAAGEHILELSEAMQLLFTVTRREIVKETVNLSEMAQVVTMGLTLGESTREVTIIIQPDIMVEADPRLLKVLLENLLGNAWKYTGKQGEAVIEVGATTTEDGVCCFVRDNGVGFPPDQADRLFSPFARLHDTDEFPGAGIGLATVQRIVSRHGGNIRAAGEPGQGATFSFTLPGSVGGAEKREESPDQ